jgi:TRAP transporter TAXI family solute receptor
MLKSEDRPTNRPLKGMQGCMAGKDVQRARWPLIAIAVTAVIVLIAAFMVVRTMPPRVVVMATGTEGGAYHEIGKRYKEILAHAGVELRLRQTGGSVEALLGDPRSGVSVGLVQGGSLGDIEVSELESLGTVFYEPLWLFTRSELGGTGLGGLRGRKLSIGPEGSGTRVLALELLKRQGIDKQVGELLPFGAQAAGEKLLAGEIDAAIMLISWDSPVAKQLLADERVAVASFPHTDAYVALYPYLNKVVVPAGLGDLAKNRPATDVTLFAPKASLVVRKDLSSAIQFLLLTAAVQIHSGPGVFQRAGQFPAAEAIDVPMSGDALQFYKSGRPFLQNYLPFWMASLVGRLLILLIPIVGVLYPLMRFLPALYGWIMKSKISRLYGELRFLEDQMAASGTGNDRSKIVAELDRLEEQANHLKVSTGYANMLYMLRNHIALVRERLAGQV